MSAIEKIYHQMGVISYRFGSPKGVEVEELFAVISSYFNATNVFAPIPTLPLSNPC
jgi:hypothetical protein